MKLYFVCKYYMSTQCNVIQQIRRSRVSTTMPLRFDNLVNSPYPTYTKYELDMRRKAEILEYKSSNKGTLQNTFTKSQKYSQIVNGIYQPKNNCPNTIQYIPTYYSDVPGPVEYLYLNPDIPLYNYQVIREYTDLYYVDDEKWKYTSYTNIQFNINNNSLIGSLYIKDAIDDTNYTFTLKIPINIYVTGINNTQNDIDFVRRNSDFIINSIVFSVYYNGTSLNSPGIAKRVEPYYNLEDVKSLNLNTTNSGTNRFNANIFTGYITISNINLYTAKGYVYDFNLSVNTGLNINDVNYVQSDYYSAIDYYSVINSTEPNVSSNCITTTLNHYTTRIVSITGTNTKNASYSSSISLSGTL